jgi:hypothetical protein
MQISAESKDHFVIKENIFYIITMTLVILYIIPMKIRALIVSRDKFLYVRLEVFTAATMKNGVFLDVTPCASCKNRRFGGT